MITARNTSDQKLLEGILKAESKAISTVYDQVLPHVITWVRQNNGSEADARDIFQEAMMALFRRLEEGDFDLTCQLKSYIKIMCRNLWMTRLRDNKPVTEMDEDVNVVELDGSVIEKIEHSDRHRLFLKHFDQLEEMCQRILALFFDKTSLREIAQKLSTSEGYVKKRKFICKERLVTAVQADPLFAELKS